MSTFAVLTCTACMKRQTYIFCSFHISDQPEIEVDQTWIPTGEGIEAEVSCNIHAEPVPEVKFILYFPSHLSSSDILSKFIVCWLSHPNFFTDILMTTSIFMICDAYFEVHLTSMGLISSLFHEAFSFYRSRQYCESKVLYNTEVTRCLMVDCSLTKDYFY